MSFPSTSWSSSAGVAPPFCFSGCGRMPGRERSEKDEREPQAASSRAVMEYLNASGSS